MANGNVAYLPVLEPPSPPVQNKPASHAEICAAMVSAVTGLCRMAKELQNDGLTAATRRESALLVYRVHELRRSMPEIDFASMATRESTQVLCRSLADNADFCRSYSASAGEAVIERLISAVITAADEVAAFEKSMAH